jgi:hypothetical protein
MLSSSFITPHSTLHTPHSTLPMSHLCTQVVLVGLLLAGSGKAGMASPQQEPLTQDSPRQASPSRLELSGTLRSEAALRLHTPLDLTKLREVAYLRGKYTLDPSERSATQAVFHFTARAHYDAVFALTRQYPAAVRQDEQSKFDLREAVVTLTTGRWDLRLGLQQTVWGEAVGLFFADVVNPKDYREFLLRDFDDIRLPQWALDMRYGLGKEQTLEFYWSPDPRISRLALPGAEFAFFRPSPPAGIHLILEPEAKPIPSLQNHNIGLRYAWLRKGWDSALFFYHAFDDLPAVSKRLRVIEGVSMLDVRRLHPHVTYLGGTFSKPNGNGVWRGEAVYLVGRRYETAAPGEAIQRDALTTLLGASYPAGIYNLDIQLFQTTILGSTHLLSERAARVGLSLRFADDASTRRMKPELLLVVSPNQKDFWFSPKLHFRVSSDSTLTVGMDWFNGPLPTLFGQFRDRKRLQVQWSRLF